jgi:hypothetical protein
MTLPNFKKPIVLFSTKKMFWPSSSFIMKWAEYVREMEREGRAFLSCEQYYTMEKQLGGKRV